MRDFYTHVTAIVPGMRTIQKLCGKSLTFEKSLTVDTVRGVTPYHRFKLPRKATEQSVGAAPPVIVRLMNAVAKLLNAFVKINALNRKATLDR